MRVRPQVAESLFLKAKRPELALKMYRDKRLWHDALRLAEDWNLPNKAAEIQAELAAGAFVRVNACLCLCACVHVLVCSWAGVQQNRQQWMDQVDLVAGSVLTARVHLEQWACTGVQSGGDAVHRGWACLPNSPCVCACVREYVCGT